MVPFGDRCGQGGAVSWTLERDDAVVTLLFFRPPDDQVRRQDLLTLRAHLADIADDPTASVVVLTGGRPGSFVGHADLADIEPMRRGVDGRHVLEDWGATTTALELLPQPVVAAIDGPAVGGGCELALAATVRLAGPSARFCQVEITRGAVPGAAATQRLPRLVGLGRAAHIILTGREIGQDEAVRIGLADELVSGPHPVQAMHDWALALAERSRTSLVAAKAALRASQRLPLDEGLRREQDLFLQVIDDAVRDGAREGR